MNLSITILLILSIVGQAAFGFLGVLCESGAGHNCCIAELIAKTVTGQACPQNNALAYIDFHFGALKSLSTAVFGAFDFVFIIFGLMGMVLVLARTGIYHKINLRLPLLLHYLSQDPMEGVFQFKKKYIRWLSLLEKCDAVYSF